MNTNENEILIPAVPSADENAAAQAVEPPAQDAAQVADTATPLDAVTQWERQRKATNEAVETLYEKIEAALLDVKKKKLKDELKDAVDDVVNGVNKLQTIAYFIHDNPDFDPRELQRAQGTFDVLMRLGIANNMGAMLGRAAHKVLFSDSTACLTVQIVLEKGDKLEELNMRGKLAYTVKTNESFTGLTWKKLFLNSDGFFRPDADGQLKLPLAQEMPEESEETPVETSDTVSVAANTFLPQDTRYTDADAQEDEEL